MELSRIEFEKYYNHKVREKETSLFHTPEAIYKYRSPKFAGSLSRNFRQRSAFLSLIGVMVSSVDENALSIISIVLNEKLIYNKFVNFAYSVFAREN